MCADNNPVRSNIIKAQQTPQPSQLQPVEDEAPLEQAADAEVDSPNPAEAEAAAESEQAVRLSSHDLADMIERAQEERFKLMRAIKTQMYGPSSSDGSGVEAGFNDARDRRTAHQKIEMVDAWVNRRLEQLRDADDQLDQRIDQLNRLESSVQTLTNGLASQLEKATPNGEHTRKLREKLWESTAEVLDEAKGQLDERLEAISQTNAQLEQRLVEIKQQIHEGVEPVHNKLKEALQQTATRIGKLTKLFDEKVEAGFLDYQQRADETANHAADEIDQYLKRFDAAVNLVIEDKRQAADQMFEQVKGNIRQKYEDQIRQYDGLLENKSRQLQLQHGELSRQLDQDTATHIQNMQQRLASAMDAATRLLGDRVAEFRNDAEKSIDDAVNEANRNIQNKYDERLNEHNDRLGKTLTARQQQMDQQFAEMCDLLDDKLTDYGDKVGKQIARRTEQLQRQHDELGQTFDLQTRQLVAEKQEMFEETFARCRAENDKKAEDQFEQIASDIEQISARKISESEEQFNRQINEHQTNFETLLSSIDQQVKDRYNQVTDQVASMTAAQMYNLHRQMAEVVEERKEAMDEQLTAVRKEAEVATDLVQRQLSRRLETVKPQAEKQLQEMDEMFHARVDLRLDNARSRIAQIESQLNDMTSTLAEKSQQVVDESQHQIAARQAQINQQFAAEVDASEKAAAERMLKMKQQMAEASKQINEDIDSICDRVSRLTGVEAIEIDMVGETLGQIRAILTEAEIVTGPSQDAGDGQVSVDEKVMDGSELLDKMKHVASRLHANSQPDESNVSSSLNTEADIPQIQGPNVTVKSPDTPLPEAG